MRYCFVFVIACCFSGCLMEAVTVTAIQGEMAAQSAASGNRALGKAKDTKSKIEIESAVNSYAGTTGTYPVTLDALVPAYIAAVPVQSNGVPFGYDATSGRVTLVALGAGSSATDRNLVFTQTDAQNLDRLRRAVYKYWETTGYYPESIASLAPLYIQNVPAMSSGAAFPYNKQTGLVSHPGEYAGTRPGQPAGRNGASGQATSITDGHSQRQLKALDDLGF